jgi:hypothetical protein
VVQHLYFISSLSSLSLTIKRWENHRQRSDQPMKDDLKDSLSAIRDKKLKTINPATEEVLNEYELISKGQLNDTINKSKYTRADFLYSLDLLRNYERKSLYDT